MNCGRPSNRSPRMSDRRDEAGRDVVFFEGDWPYRTWRSLVMFVAGGGCAALFVALVRKLVNGDVRDQRTAVTFAALTLFSLAFGGIGMWVGWLYLRGATSHLRIDDRGITYGSSFVDWENVGRFFVTQDREGLSFTYHRRSRRRFVAERLLITLPRPNRDQCDDVIGRLRKHLRTRHPHVEVG